MTRLASVLYRIGFGALLLTASIYGHSSASEQSVGGKAIAGQAYQPVGHGDNGYEIDFNSTPLLKTVFVTNRKGTSGYQFMNADSEKLMDYGYGERLEVIEDNQGWYGVRDRIYRAYKTIDGDMDQITWERVYVKKGDTGTGQSHYKRLPNKICSR